MRRHIIPEELEILLEQIAAYRYQVALQEAAELEVLPGGQILRPFQH